MSRGYPTRLISACTIAVATAGCGSSETTAVDKQVNPELTTATDLSDDVNVTEIDLEAREGRQQYKQGRATPVWTYNGSVPGPLIDVHVGERLLVHFTNSLPEATTIHWHGVRLPAAMDGTLRMQEPVPPGGSFDYTFDIQDAGLFWFHPHIRSDEQVEKGLYGVIRARGKAEPEVDQESIWVLDDVNILPDGALSTYLDDNSKMLGRQGNTLLVNGQATPRFTWRSGALQRLRIVNVANGRFFNLSLAGYTWRVIGTDGGPVPNPYETERLLLSPGERYDVLVVPMDAPKTELTLVNEPYERGHETGEAPPMAVATIEISGEEPLTERSFPETTADVEALEDGPADHELELNEMLDGENLVFTINDATFPDVPLIDVRQGDVRRFDVINASEMDHPFHLHGTFFQILSANGTTTAPERLANKDTVIVPQMSTLRLAARFDEPGGWMYHCHILEHAEGGMMGEIDVEGPE